MVCGQWSVVMVGGSGQWLVGGRVCFTFEEPSSNKSSSTKRLGFGVRSGVGWIGVRWSGLGRKKSGVWWVWVGWGGVR